MKPTLEKTSNPLSALLVSQDDIPRAMWSDWKRLTPPEKIQALIDYNDRTGRLDAAVSKSKLVKIRRPRAKRAYQRVRMTSLALLRGLRGTRTGWSVGASRDGKFIYVVKDGRSSRKAFSAEYWEPLEAPSVPNGTENQPAPLDKPKS